MTDLKGRCGTCARFTRVVETIDANGEVSRHGECLLGVWGSPLLESKTCGQYVERGTFELRKRKPEPRTRALRGTGSRGGGSAFVPTPFVLDLPEDLLAMDADEFRRVLREVIQEELGLGQTELAARWQGGELVMMPGKTETAEKRVPLETFFHKIVMIRDKLRVLEQKVNGHDKLGDDEKIQMQQYITACYGTLTTFNVLFADKNESFAGQKGSD